MEFAHVWRTYGTQVTVVEMPDRLLPLEDTEVSAQAACWCACGKEGGEAETLEADKCLPTFEGRRASRYHQFNLRKMLAHGRST
jgi:pyruvate/2-oxoglutarate dehydrogenase complex dihydrolipoamide dehydrogenase (E3) component